jgi:N-acetylglucosaminyldiphosphoundecaprenol N-acetyl-beta-D-mannosaminyltransferase
MLRAINNAAPDVLWVGLTAPKQEKWVYTNKENIDANTIVSIGAVFDFYAGTVKRPNKIWISLGLEWFPRFLREPKRLAKRNLVSTPKFLLEIILQVHIV